MTASLSPEVKALIAKARIVSFAGWSEQYGAARVAQLQAADDSQQYLSDEALQGLPGAAIAKTLRDRAADLVDQARAEVLAQFPQITEPGGGLYPPLRAEACWRDFWQFLRCVTYGIAAQRQDYTSATGLAYMEQLYQVLQVPLDAMVCGIKALKAASLQTLTAEQAAKTAPYFDRLIHALEQFQTAAAGSS